MQTWYIDLAMVQQTHERIDLGSDFAEASKFSIGTDRPGALALGAVAELMGGDWESSSSDHRSKWAIDQVCT